MRWLMIAALALAPGLNAQEADTTADATADTERKEFVRSLKFQTGRIDLPAAEATLNLPPSFRYLSAADAERVLSDLWGNPPGTNSLGMLVPTAIDLADGDNSWAIALEYESDGYVSDADANDIDYSELLEEMQEETLSWNEEREQQGYPRVELIGWAEAPRYDAAAHKLHWAKEIAFGGDSAHTLNYDVRVLGRKGVLIMQAVASMPQLQQIKPEMNEALASVEFNQGARYAEFDEGTDKVAGYGLAALVAGGIASKAGLFTKLIALLVAFKKVIFIGLGAVMYGAARLFGKKKDG